MAITKTINLEVNTKDAQKSLKGLEKGVEDVNKEVKDTSKTTQQMGGTLDKISGGAVSKFAAFKSAVAGVTTGFKSLRVAIIATGIGALLIAVTALGQAFTRSEEGQNKFAKILGVIGSVTGNLLDLLADLGESIISVFENPKQAIKDFASLIKDNITTRFEGLINLIPNLGKAVEQLFKGNFKEAGKIAGDSLGQVVLGVDSITDSVNGAIESVKDFGEEVASDAKAAAKIADQRAKAEKEARKLITERAQAEQDIARLREKAVNKEKFTAEERIQFLEEAGQISADLAAKETEVAKLRLEAKLTENELTKSTTQDLNEAAQLEANVIQLETQRLNLQKRLSTELLTARREAKTAAKEEPVVIDEKLKKIEEIQKAYRQKQEDADAETELQKINLEEQRKLKELNDLEATEDQKLEVLSFYANKRKDLKNDELENDKKITQAKKDLENELLSNVANAVGAIGNLFEKGTAASKASALAEIAIGTGIGFINALDIAQKSAKGTGPAAAFAFPIFYASQIASVLGAVAQAKNILSTVKGGGGSGGSPSAPNTGGSSSQPPAFNVVGSSGETQLADAIGSQTQRPSRAYVVSNDVTTAQEMDRNIIEGASI
jgi:hypothetical protein